MNTPDLGFTYRWEPASPVSNHTLLLLHGTGGTESDLIEMGRSVAPGYNLLSPRGKVSENGMARFFKRLAAGVFDVEDLKKRSVQLGDFIRRAVKEFGLENHKIIAMGYSNGANIASGLIFHDPDLLTGAVLLRPMIPYEPERINLEKIKILMISGVFDTTMNEDEPEKLEQIFRANRADVISHSLSTSHGLTTDDLRLTKEWLKSNF